MNSCFARALLTATIALAGCAAEGPPVLDPSTPMTTRTLNTSLDCADFQQNADGSWSPVHDVIVATPNGPVTAHPDTQFREGGYFMGRDVGWALNRDCKK
jgi:hypothetical protein